MSSLNPFVLWPGYERLARDLAALRDPDLDPLFDAWLDLIVEDNRVGVLAGLDKDGAPLAPVTYRNGRVRPVKFRQGAAMGTRAGRFKGRRKGGQGRLPNNNLTTEEYKLYDGGPLAPRGEHSRVIANLVKRTPRKNKGVWEILCAWLDVLDPKGRALLPRHFEGRGRLPQRDLRGVRPQGMERAVAALDLFVQDLLSRGR